MSDTDLTLAAGELVEGASGWRGSGPGYFSTKLHSELFL